MSTNSGLMARRVQAIPRGIGNLYPVVAQRASNAELWDVEGKRYLDFAGGIAVLNTGHVHPTVIAAVRAQLERFSHTCFGVAAYEPYIELAERLNALTPGDGPKKTLLMNTGVEAVENAIKIARHYTGRPGVLAFAGGFHGRTLLGMALTGKTSPYKTGFGPMPAEVFHAPFPCPYHGVGVDDALAGIDHILKSQAAPDRIGAVVVEPVQGEGGFNVAPKRFIDALQRLCEQHGWVLVFDEVQTGFCRTGKMFAAEHYGVVPDLITMAKSLAGGFPLSAVTGSADIMDSPAPGGLGSTYGGSPVGCAAALGVLDVIAAEQLAERAVRIGQLLTARLDALAASHACIGDVRGLGAMMAMELVRDRKSREPDAALTGRLVNLAAERGLLLLSCGTRGNVIRFLMPLTTPEEQIHEGMDILERCLTDAVRTTELAGS